MSNNELDFTEDTNQEASPDTLKKISDLASTHIELTNRLTNYAKVAKELKDRLTQIEAETIPSLMEECGMAAYKLDDGSEITIKDIFAASIPSTGGITKAKGEKKEELVERRAECLGWLNEHGGASIIKNEFVFSLGTEDSSKVDELKVFAGQIALPWSNDENVHPQTLNAFLKEKLNKGDDIPSKTFSIFTSKIAKIKQPKKLK